MLSFRNLAIYWETSTLSTKCLLLFYFSNRNVNCETLHIWIVIFEHFQVDNETSTFYFKIPQIEISFQPINIIQIQRDSCYETSIEKYHTKLGHISVVIVVFSTNVNRNAFDIQLLRTSGNPERRAIHSKAMSKVRFYHEADLNILFISKFNAWPFGGQKVGNSVDKRRISVANWKIKFPIFRMVAAFVVAWLSVYCGPEKWKEKKNAYFCTRCLCMNV